MAVEREILIAQTGTADGMKISWGGVFGGVLAGIGTLLLLTSLGLAIGISAVDPRDTDAGNLGAGAAIWTTLSLLVALFVAGWASTRLSMLWERTTAIFEGALVWVMSLILILYLTANGVGLLASGAFGMLGSAAQSASTAMTAPAGSDPAQAAAEARQRLSDLTERAKQNLPQRAAEAKPEATTAAWLAFAALVLSLVASVAGAAVGRRNVERRVTGP